MKKIPRYYQIDAKKATYKGWHYKQVPYIEVCTGGGKSLICADITEDVLQRDKRILQLVSTKKLVLQNYQEAFEYVTDKSKLGIVCNKLGKIQNHHQAVVSMMKSFYKYRAVSGAFDVCLIDECDLVSPDEETQYRKIIRSLLRLNPDMLIGGLTASPYRDDQGMLHDPCKKGTPLFTHLVYSTPITRMMSEGYLSNIKNISGDVHVDLEGVRTVAGDYDKAQIGVKFDAILSDGVRDLREKADLFEIETAIIFASNIANAYKICEEWGDDTMRVSHGSLTEKELDENLHWLEYGNGSRFLVNVGLYIRGFDYQQLQMVGLFLATKILSKYVQIVGRVLRAHEEKPMAYIWDCGTNIDRHGPIDNLTPPLKRIRSGDAPKKPCLAIVEKTVEFEGLTYRAGYICNYLNILSAKLCKVCGASFISSEDGNYSMKTKGDILREKLEESKEDHEINSIIFDKHVKDDRTMVKAVFYDHSGEYVHTEYFPTTETGEFYKFALEKIKDMLIDKQDFYRMQQFSGGMNAKSLLFLFGDEYYDKYFKTIKSISLVRDGRFKKLVSWKF
jgi:superfamily II DNA or RNA helicase